jgi:type I restriction-modification system DNA methylase subunit
MKSYSELTLKITKDLSKSEKKAYGFFVTPPSIITILIEKTSGHISNVSRILEPSCGSCEFVTSLIESGKYSSAVIDAVEFNKKVFDSIINITFKTPVNLIHQDFLTYENGKYDLIIGNPPYFVMSKEDVPEKYREFVVGRPNIFGIFIIHAISMLSENGILSFIIPKSFLNASYYSKIRDYIQTTCTILDIIDFEDNNDFLETQQATLGLILQKKTPTVLSNFSINLGDHYVFTENATHLKKLFEGSSNLKQLGFSVKTGNIVWNQHKGKLTCDNKKTLLIYNTNIEGSQIVEKTFNNDEKKQYIDLEGQKGIVLVVNRGNGNSAYKLTYSLVNLGDRKYLVENHLNVIVYNGPGDHIDKYNSIVRSFQDPRTAEFIKIFLGNNGLSKSELETIFPIYV